jgi:hypothetical protein
MMVGYALNHPGDTYRMWDPKTKRVHLTRDVTWLRRMFYPKALGAGVEIGDQPVVDVIFPEIPNIEVGEGIDDEDLKENNNQANESNYDDENPEENDDGDTANEEWTQVVSNRSGRVTANEEWTQVVSNRSGRVIKPPARLIEEMNAVAIENYYSVLEHGDDAEWNLDLWVLVLVVDLMLLLNYM